MLFATRATTGDIVMKHRSQLRARLFADTRGLTTVEYVMLACLLVVAGWVTWRRLGRTIEGTARRGEMIVVRVGPSSP